jgi:hypothetical protein
MNVKDDLINKQRELLDKLAQIFKEMTHKEICHSLARAYLALVQWTLLDKLSEEDKKYFIKARKEEADIIKNVLNSLK